MDMFKERHCTRVFPPQWFIYPPQGPCPVGDHHPCTTVIYPNGHNAPHWSGRAFPLVVFMEAHIPEL